MWKIIWLCYHVHFFHYKATNANKNVFEMNDSNQIMTEMQNRWYE